ncbi:MAG: hypothetical protein JSR46_04770 [Verrucomicrobia bacterium]|nr:hypothetical protein [Verrucomicrobiota bacterium]
MPALNIKDFPEDLHHILRERAKRDRRSLTGEVIYLLEWALATTQGAKGSILQLRGLGKNHWKGIDASKLIEKERELWD